MSAILEASGLRKSYGSFRLKDISFSIQEDCITGFIGVNGSGKTTLIKLINGLLTPTSGSLTVCGGAPGVETKKVVAYLPDSNYLNSWMTVGQLVDMFCDFYEDFRRDTAIEMLTRLGITTGVRLKTLSKGNKEKVSLILVMSRSAKLYVLDEPIAGVDPASRDVILSIIMDNFAHGVSILLSTHIISDVERILDDVVFLDRGRVKLASPAAQLREREGRSVDALFREVFRC